MRRSREEASETRRRIVEAASRLFRARGIAEVGVAEAMGSLGLTVGGFYKHFESKDALVGEAIEAASLETTAALAQTSGPQGRRQRAMERYLSDEHIANAAYGCPVAALAGEAAHGSEAERHAMRRAIERTMATLGPEKGEDASARRRFLVDYATAVGAVVLARALRSSEMAGELVAAVRDELLSEK